VRLKAYPSENSKLTDNSGDELESTLQLWENSNIGGTSVSPTPATVFLTELDS